MAQHTQAIGLVLTVLTLLVLASPVPLALAQSGGPSTEDQQLAETYAPVLYFHPDELYRPQPVDVLVNAARLRQARRGWFDVNVLLDVSIPDLADYRDSNYALDVWYGDGGSSDYKNYSAHQAYYEQIYSPEAGGPPMAAYAHVVRDENPQHITIQYWLFYYYNDWFNKHEGDWEMVEVVLSAAGDPKWLVVSQHHGGGRRPWSATQVEEGTHPAVYVALGSHANYFWGNENYANGQAIGNSRVEIMDRTGIAGRAIPDVTLIPAREQLEEDPASWPGSEWLLFRGHWGETAAQGDLSGPFGPADKGEQWEQPYAWAMVQPLDTDTWYANRLRVEVNGAAGQDAYVTLWGDRPDLSQTTETLPGLALLHTDPAAGETFGAVIEAPSGQVYDIVATWPDVETSQVIRYCFDDVSLPASGLVRLALGENLATRLEFPGSSQALELPTIELLPAAWDAPDLVWVVGVLPASEVLKGVALSLLAGLLPTLLYVGMLYWADRYEKEPVRLLAAAFMWGAVPAVLVAITVRLFFQLPFNLLGPGAIEAVRAGLVVPLIEEALKGLVILFIAWRYRLEFDNVLDGIIYGAMVGFGFAMTANVLSYLGAFLLYGFTGLGGTVFVEGVLYGLNQALYSAIFGAGLGYARLAQHRWQRWAVPLAAFGLAVAAHALHSFALHTTTGLNLATIAMTWAGVLVMVAVMVWSLRRQRQCLATELAGEVPDEVLRSVTSWRGRMRAQWRALLRDGLRGLAWVRRLHQQCAELAFKKMQRRQRPDEPGLPEEVRRLRKELRALMEMG